ncbi:hypothetical protein WHZ77_29500 [Bradyrhizobium sp. A5]|uniref:hypothetical protein n=1 Tax=Bradyrhizobium sp. A5 TaxID=3133696 RepID=UPI00324D3AA3
MFDIHGWLDEHAGLERGAFDAVVARRRMRKRSRAQIGRGAEIRMMRSFRVWTAGIGNCWPVLDQIARRNTFHLEVHERVI